MTSGYRVLAVRAIGEEGDDLYPGPALVPDAVQEEPEDGGDLSTTIANSIVVSGGGAAAQDVKISDLNAVVTATGCRLTIACTKFVKGGGRYTGFGAGLLVAAALNTASRAHTAYERRGQMLVGQVRYPWIEAVLFRDAVKKRRGVVRVVFLDPTSDSASSAISLDLGLSAGMPASLFAVDLAVMAAVHMIEMDPQMPAADLAHLDALIESPAPRMTASGELSGFSLTPDANWLH